MELSELLKMSSTFPISGEILYPLVLLKRRDMSFGGKDGILRVFKGAKNILKAYRKTSNLYFLDGQTVTGDAAVASKGSSDTDR